MVATNCFSNPRNQMEARQTPYDPATSSEFDCMNNCSLETLLAVCDKYVLVNYFHVGLIIILFCMHSL